MADLNDVDYNREVKELDEQRVKPVRVPQPAPFVVERELASNEGALKQDKLSDSDQDMAVASGISLDMDSPEYWERDMDLKGIPQDEHDRLSLEMQQRGERVGQRDERESDQWHEEYSEDMVDDKVADVDEYELSAARLQPRRIVSARHLEKLAIIEEMEGIGHRAQQTRTKQDDKRYEALVEGADDLGVTELRREANELASEVEVELAE